MAYLTLIHNGYGSMVEGSEARDVLGPFGTLTQAEQAGNEFCDAVDEILNDGETWFTTIEIPHEPVLNAKERAAQYTSEFTV